MNPFTIRTNPPARLAAILLGACLVFLAACGHLKYLKSSQQQFNNCSKQHNLWLFKADADGSQVQNQTPQCYQLAYSDVKKALKNPSALRKDDVLANAYQIKALCEWQLKMYDEAQVSAKDAEKEYVAMEAKGISMPRDMIVVKMLPNLVEINKTKNNLDTFTATSTPTFESGRTFYLQHIFNPDSNKPGKLQAAIQKINKIREMPNGNTDLTGYMIQAQLAGLKSWANSIEKLLFESAKADPNLNDAQKTEALKFWKPQREALDKQKKELIDALIKLQPLGKDDPMVKFWDALI